MQLNAEDGGSRKFILVQLDEAIDKQKSNAAYNFCIENNFKPVISSICIERLNRAGDKIKQGLNQKQGKLFDKKKPADIGYKVFSLNKKPEVISKPKEQKQLFNINNNRSVLDTLVNMLCATCKTLDTKINEIIKDKVYKADNEIYILANIKTDDLSKISNIKNLKINLDGWANINLEEFLNLNETFKENLTIVY